MTARTFVRTGATCATIDLTAARTGAIFAVIGATFVATDAIYETTFAAAITETPAAIAGTFAATGVT